MARLLDKIIGHEVQIERLLSTQRMGRLPATMIFAGRSGVGKKKVALGLAQSLVCERGVGGCGQCPPCVRVEKGQSEGLLLIEPQSGSPSGTVKKDESHEILRFVSLQLLGRARVVVVDEVHSMNRFATNALLKVLEEPPPSSYFFLITSQPAALLETLRSRAQTIWFAPLTVQQVNRAQPTEEWVARACGGSLEAAEQLSQPQWTGLRALARQVWMDLVISDKGIDSLAALKKLAEDRNSALFVCQVWQTLARDLGVGQSDLPASFALNPHAIYDLWQKAFETEQIIQQNGDRLLALEEFWLGARRVYTERAL